MNRRRFLAALLATPVVAALAPLLPKNPRRLWFGLDPALDPAFDRVITVQHELNHVLETYLSDIKLSINRSILFGPPGVHAQGEPIKFEWQEDA